MSRADSSRPSRSAARSKNSVTISKFETSAGRSRSESVVAAMPVALPADRRGKPVSLGQSFAMGGRGLSRVAAAIALVTAASAAAPARSAPLDTHSCAWLFRLSGDQVNAAFPDSAAKYWVAELPIPPGFHIDLTGQFPHARYISFITYDAASRAIDGIADDEIAPDANSSNPFVAGADRNVASRSYVVHVRNEVAPAAGRAPNTIYTERPDQPTKT